jgi:hypothetical protein
MSMNTEQRKLVLDVLRIAEDECGFLTLDECHAFRALLAERDALAAALRMTEFGFNHSRCPVCAGFNVGPNGETDRVHTKTCPVALALAAASGQEEG